MANYDMTDYDMADYDMADYDMADYDLTSHDMAVTIWPPCVAESDQIPPHRGTWTSTSQTEDRREYDNRVASRGLVSKTVLCSVTMKMISK